MSRPLSLLAANVLQEWSTFFIVFCSVFGVWEYLTGCACLCCHSLAAWEDEGSELPQAAGTDPESLCSSAIPVSFTREGGARRTPRRARGAGKVLMQPTRRCIGILYRCQAVMVPYSGVKGWIWFCQARSQRHLSASLSACGCSTYNVQTRLASEPAKQKSKAACYSGEE